VPPTSLLTRRGVALAALRIRKHRPRSSQQHPAATYPPPPTTTPSVHTHTRPLRCSIPLNKRLLPSSSARAKTRHHLDAAVSLSRGSFHHTYLDLRKSPSPSLRLSTWSRATITFISPLNRRALPRDPHRPLLQTWPITAAPQVPSSRQRPNHRHRLFSPNRYSAHHEPRNCANIHYGSRRD